MSSDNHNGHKIGLTEKTTEDSLLNPHHIPHQKIKNKYSRGLVVCEMILLKRILRKWSLKFLATWKWIRTVFSCKMFVNTVQRNVNCVKSRDNFVHLLNYHFSKCHAYSYIIGNNINDSELFITQHETESILKRCASLYCFSHNQLMNKYTSLLHGAESSLSS